MTPKKTVIDPELQRQLKAADKDRNVEVVITLRAPANTFAMETQKVEQTVDRLIKQAQDASGQKVSDLHVMPYAQSFAMVAPAGVVAAILKNSEIASAMANAQPEDMMIKPVPRPRKKSPGGGGKSRKGDS